MKRIPLLNLTCRFHLSVFITSTLLLFCFFSCQNAEEKSDKPILQFSQFISETPLKITITTNLKSLFEKKDDPEENEEEVFQKAKCEILLDGEPFFDGKIKVKKRGVTRKKRCDIHPMMMKIGRSE